MMPRLCVHLNGGWCLPFFSSPKVSTINVGTEPGWKTVAGVAATVPTRAAMEKERIEQEQEELKKVRALWCTLYWLATHG